MKKHGRSRKEVKLDNADVYKSMTDEKPSAGAARAFHRRAYEIGAPGIREDPDQSMLEYLADKYNIKRELKGIAD